MEEPKPNDVSNNNTTSAEPKTESRNPLQWFREGIAGIISLVILVMAAVMLWGTYNYAKDATPTADANVVSTRKESYERQKDIMLYALALLGTVTGYYLGRVPAELHAQQAQRSANAAQDQLQKTQTKLTDTAGSAAVAATQVAVAENEKATAKAHEAKAVKGLENANEAISKTLSTPVSKTLGAEGPVSAKNLDNLRQAQQEIERTLRELQNSRF
jgi:hypothetical protein